MSDRKFYKGKPVEGGAIDELLKSWPIPDVSEDETKYSGRSTAFGQPLEQVYQKQHQAKEAEPEAQEPEEFPTLTLEELEQIRQDAYEEGIKQGHEQGYIEGFEKGVNDGKEAGYKEGIEIGKEQGLNDAKPLVEEKLQYLGQLIEGIAAPLNKVDETVEKQLVHLAKLLAEQVVFKELQTHPELILVALKKAIDALPMGEQAVKIHLNPEDLSLAEEAYGVEHLQQEHWQLVAEPTLDRGGCEVKTAQSSIDMTLKTRLNEIMDKFLHDSGI
ncbi:flagellar assembly protein FliH [Pseudoalteromonas phenolica]|uniref:Flagellar assembly protein FliH n=1 Tax=Pseudoalteromonas phenolica TaxID=161398 RepID=A0A4Q7IK64_9GAMM|nr:flagellar assembly protein FliH [Pseudoalteromonas phenolica]RZQ52563.1 flagellar assembly protein FliH [Pseudoalteromonas phenolica]